MNADSGNINQFVDAKDAADNEREFKQTLRRPKGDCATTKRALIPISDEHIMKLSGMSASARKNWMRNKACPCESGKKFKRCCWDKFTH